jgi:hypothetical protein
LRTALTETQLPLSFFVTLSPPGVAKDNSDVKLNFVLNKAAPSVVSLFEDVVESLQARDISTNKKQMTFVYHN